MYDKSYYERNKEVINQKQKEYYHKKKKNDPEWYKREIIRKRTARREYHNRKGRESALRRKLIIINHYGGKCACCGESNHEFLAIDHINGGGNEHRRQMGIKGGRHFYDWLFKNNFPDGFQVLCHNCNFAKDHFISGCPHKKEVIIPT